MEYHSGSPDSGVTMNQERALLELHGSDRLNYLVRLRCIGWELVAYRHVEVRDVKRTQKRRGYLALGKERRVSQRQNCTDALAMECVYIFCIERNTAGCQGVWRNPRDFHSLYRQLADHEECS